MKGVESITFTCIYHLLAHLDLHVRSGITICFGMFQSHTAGKDVHEAQR